MFLIYSKIIKINTLQNLNGPDNVSVYFTAIDRIIIGNCNAFIHDCRFHGFKFLMSNIN